VSARCFRTGSVERARPILGHGMFSANSKSAPLAGFGLSTPERGARVLWALLSHRYPSRSVLSRFALPVFAALFLPAVNLGSCAHAGFVLRVSEAEAVAFGEDASRVGKFDITPNRCHSVSTQTEQPEPTSPRYVWIYCRESLPFNTGPLPFSPPKRRPAAPNLHQGAGGSPTHLQSGSSVFAAGLPYVPMLVGSELAMRLFAREARLHVEEHAGRLFRPPRFFA
jgi:hypothetical protein